MASNRTPAQVMADNDMAVPDELLRRMEENVRPILNALDLDRERRMRCRDSEMFVLTEKYVVEYANPNCQLALI